jgi:hypothetical protein
MRTDELIHMLARQAGPAPRALAAQRLGVALGGGALLGLLGSWLLIGPIPLALFADPAPWIKLAYALALAAAATTWLTRLGRPGAPTRVRSRLTAGVVLLMGGLGLASLWATPPGERLQAMLGNSWAVCPALVLGLSLPTLALTLWAMRGMAPTRPQLTGLAAGVLAGAVGAFSYAFACDEMATSFVAVWYTLGIAMAGALGAWLGPRCLRW